jgi:hypothetical protein
MRTTLLLLALLAAATAQDWPTVGGNNEHNGYARWRFGPAQRQVLWETQTLPSNLGMQAYTWGDYVVTTRYSFSPMSATLVCHDLRTGDTVWTRLYRPDGKFIPMGVSQGRLYSRNFRESGHDSIFCTDVATGEILWQSRWTAPLGIVWCAVFAENGDVITPCAERGIARLDRTTGDTVWTNPRPIPNTGAEWIAMTDTFVLAWEGLGINRPKYLIAISANTGQTLWRTPELPGDGDQELPFVIGPDGRVFGQRDGGLFYCWQLTDSGLVELWTGPGYGGSTWQDYGIGPDYSLYLPRGTRILRLDYRTGAVRDSSPPLASADITPRITVDEVGNVFAMVSTSSGAGGLRALSYDLQELWRDDISYCYYSGPALAARGNDNVMVVAGPGTLLRAYQGPVGVAEGPSAPYLLRLSAAPNPFRTSVRFSLSATGPLGNLSARPLQVFDASARLVRTIAPSPSPLVPFTWDGRDDSGRSVAPGTYICRAITEAGPATVRVILSR